MVAGIDRFLLREIAESVAQPAAALAARSVERREIQRVGRAQSRPAGQDHRRARPREPRSRRWSSSPRRREPALVGRSEHFEAFAVRWPAVRGVTSEGLAAGAQGTHADRRRRGHCPMPIRRPSNWPAWRRASRPRAQFARRLAESGCRVVVPALIDRADTLSAIGPRGTNQPHREFLVSPGVRDGPAHHRLRSAKSAGRRRLVRARRRRAASGRSA